MANTNYEFPFSSLTDNNISEVFQTDSDYYNQIFKSNGFNDFIKEYSLQNSLDDTNQIDCKYYSLDSLNDELRTKNKFLKVLNLNVRRIAPNLGKLKVFLSSLRQVFEIIILTEIGDDAQYYITQEHFPGYDFYLDVPVSNRYGGAAILVREDLGTVTVRNDLSMKKTCNCSQCAWENIWVDLTTSQMSITLGAIYRHPHGNVDHFNEKLDNSS